MAYGMEGADRFTKHHLFSHCVPFHQVPIEVAILASYLMALTNLRVSNLGRIYSQYKNYYFPLVSHLYLDGDPYVIAAGLPRWFSLRLLCKMNLTKLRDEIKYTFQLVTRVPESTITNQRSRN